ncbi:hypothetical protein M2150_002884 [Lachnospiraceae bacterium PM6-15]|uniref:hypothetical protein n=1 Tax=Ohessyouella blattaphilus TaxID=2949333 RepID=UPI003E22DCEB
MAKQCCNVITDGEETQEQNSSSSKSQHCSIAFSCHQGQALRGGYVFTSGS